MLLAVSHPAQALSGYTVSGYAESFLPRLHCIFPPQALSGSVTSRRKTPSAWLSLEVLSPHPSAAASVLPVTLEVAGVPVCLARVHSYYAQQSPVKGVVGGVGMN